MKSRFSFHLIVPGLILAVLISWNIPNNGFLRLFVVDAPVNVVEKVESEDLPDASIPLKTSSKESKAATASPLARICLFSFHTTQGYMPGAVFRLKSKRIDPSHAPPHALFPA